MYPAIFKLLLNLRTFPKQKWPIATKKQHSSFSQHLSPCTFHHHLQSFCLGSSFLDLPPVTRHGNHQATEWKSHVGIHRLTGLQPKVDQQNPRPSLWTARTPVEWTAPFQFRWGLGRGFHVIGYLTKKNRGFQPWKAAFVVLLVFRLWFFGEIFRLFPKNNF